MKKLNKYVESNNRMVVLIVDKNTNYYRAWSVGGSFYIRQY